MKKHLPIIIIIIILLISCKKIKPIQEIGNIEISQKKFIDNIDKTCKGVNNKCSSLFNLKYSYKKISKEKIILKNNIKLYFLLRHSNLKKETSPHYKTLNKEIFLFSKKENKVIDSILVFKESFNDYSAIYKYFYLNQNLDLWILDFFKDEEGTYISKWKKYKINDKNGRIVVKKELIEKRFPIKEETNAKSINSFIKEYKLSKMVKSNEITLNFNNDKFQDKIITFDYKENFDCSNNKIGVKPILILEGTENNKFKLYSYNTTVLPSACCYGNADNYLDISYSNSKLQFSSVYLSPDKQIIKRVYYFDEHLYLNKIIFTKEIIGSSPVHTLIVNKETIDKINIKDFVLDDYLETKYSF